ncbi:MAG: phage holin, LLH family [bacterium]|nr:phage holin, LLH family [bacterium]
MFKDIKENIKELAYSAVLMAEDTLSSEAGKVKKTAAVDYVISMLPISNIFKSIIRLLLNKFIDEAIEQAVEFMKSEKNGEI